MEEFAEKLECVPLKLNSTLMTAGKYAKLITEVLKEKNSIEKQVKDLLCY